LPFCKISYIIDFMEFAVIQTGGKQYKVSEGATVSIEKIKGDWKVGDKVSFDKVLLVDDGKNTTLGALTLYLPEQNGGEGIGNVAVGYEALSNSSELLNNYAVALGYNALKTGGSNKDIAIGNSALFGGNSNPGGIGKNIAIGDNAMVGGIASDGGNNIAIGTSALSTLLGNVSNNIAIGNSAGSNVSNGANNVLLGASAGSTITTGTGNVILGGYTGKSAAQNNNIAISDGAGTLRMFVTGSTGFVGVNTDNPLFGLDVNASLAAELSPLSADSNIVSWNSATDEVQYVSSMSVDTAGFNPSGSGTAANSVWLASQDGFSLGASSQVYMGYVSDTNLGGSGGNTNTLLTIPRDTYAAIWIEYITADSTYANMRTQTFIAHWDNASAIEWTNTGPEDIGAGSVPPSLTAIISSTNVLVQATSTAANQRMFGTYRLIKKI
jgi:hypothetical protein